MSVWVDLARVAAGLNVLVLLGLSYLWGRNAWRFRSKHASGLAVFAVLLLVENALALYVFAVDPALVAWIGASAPLAQAAMMALRGVELVAVVVLAWTAID
jgi:hypothetical protein